MSFPLLNSFLKRCTMFFIDALLSCLSVVIVSKSLQGEVLEELEELVIILRGWHLCYSLVEQVNDGDVERGHDFLDGTVYHSDHIFVLAKLALPKKVH